MKVDVTICEDCVHFKPYRCEIWDRMVGTHDYCSNGRPKNISADEWKQNKIKKAVDEIRSQ